MKSCRFGFCKVVFFSLILFCITGCEYWNKDMLAYLEYWSSTVQVGRLEKSGAEFKINKDGIETIPVAATPTFTAVLINPKGYALDTTKGTTSGSSVIISNSSVANLAGTPSLADKNTLFSVKLGAGNASLEHQEFTITIAPVRTDNKLAVPGQSITLQYNTPPAEPIRMNRADDDSLKPALAGEEWKADADGYLYWSWSYDTNGGTDANSIKWFSIDGQRLEIKSCQNSKTQGQSGIYCYKTGDKSVKLAAVDSEGVSGSPITSGVNVPEGTITEKVEPVTFDPPDRTYCEKGEWLYVKLDTPTPGASIKYKIGEKGNWQDYSSSFSFSITSDTTIFAYATKPGYLASEETSATYMIRRLQKIEIVTKPLTVYGVNEATSGRGMKAIVYYSNGDSKEVEFLFGVSGSWKIDCDTSKPGLNKNFTVSYTEKYNDNEEITKTATFKVDVANSQLTDTVSVVNGGTPDVGSIIEFGYWPQSKITIGGIGGNALQRGWFQYRVGSDGNYYVKEGENYYKVEPIRWKVLKKETNGTLLLLAEKILMGGIRYNDDHTETINISNNKTYKANYYENSEIRAFLTGDPILGSDIYNIYNEKGFYQGAWSQNSSFNQDSVFLLNKDDVEENIPTADRVRSPTDYVATTSNTLGWWLDTSNEPGTNAYYVDSTGEVKLTDVMDTNIGIVPAIRITYP